jgi:two-component system, LytTR family, sensor kinase
MLAFLVFAASTLTGFYFSSQVLIHPELQIVPWRKALYVNLTYYYVWGLAVPLIIAIARRVRFDQRRWALPALVHVMASVLLTSAVVVVAELVLKYVVRMRPEPFGHVLAYSFGVNFHSNVPTYWMILAAYLAIQYYNRFRDRELRASQLEARLSEARLDALKMQLRPHFLFNTLNSISSLMYVDVDAADRMITRLGDFLRLTIDGDGQQLIPLRQELEFIRRYLEIEQIRFEDRLRLEYDVDASLMDALVPSLVLQPLVENAIHHGIAPREEGGRVVIRASASGGQVILSVEDDGRGIGGEPERVRIGLGSTRARLEQLYGAACELRIGNGEHGGFAATVIFPRTNGTAAS